MPYTYSFEKLQIWHYARHLVKMVYQVTEQLPVAEKYGLISQMRRASVSIVSNIAEGTGRSTKKDQVYFYQMAFSSLIELLNQLILSNNLEYIGKDELLQLRTEIELTSNKINALRKSRLIK